MAVMKQMPSDGQFVAIYEANGKIWGDTFYKHEKDVVLQYNQREDKFIYSSFPFSGQHVIAYITLEEEYLK